MRRGGEEPLWDQRVPACLAAAFLCKLAGDLPVAFLGHHPPGAWTNPVARSLGEDRPALSAGPPLGRTTTRAQSGTPGPGCAGLLVDQGRMVTGVSVLSPNVPLDCTLQPASLPVSLAFAGRWNLPWGGVRDHS